MGFNDEYLKLRKKRLEEQESKAAAERENQSNGSRPVMLNTLTPKANSDIAPVRQTTTKKTDERKWFEKGAFEDGYQFGDLTKTIYGSQVDLKKNIGASIIGMGEKVVDALATIAPYVAQGQYYQNGGGYNIEQDKVFNEAIEQSKPELQKFVEKDLYNEEEVAKKIISDPANKVFGVDSETDSVFGEKSDALAQSAGQLGATAALQAVGVPWWLTTGATTFGSETESAFQQGATYDEAVLSATISAGAEILTEKISGGISFGGKTLDAGLTNFLAANISNKTVQALAKLGIDAVGEGGEEILSGVLSAIGQKLTYADEKEFNELFSTEEAFESFIGGLVLGGGSNLIGGVKAKAEGTDAVTGLAKDTEQKVVDKVFKDAVAEKEANGEKLSAKQKTELYNDVLNKLEKGYIDIDTIEEVLGEDVYKSYKDTIDYEDDILKQFEELGNKTNPTLAEQSLYAELKSQADGIKQNSQREAIKSRLSEEVFGKVKDTKLAESYNERARRGQHFEADLLQYDEKQQEVIKRAVDSGILNNTNRTHEFVDLIAKISADKGVLFDFTNNAKLKESGFAIDGKEVNGYVTKDGVTLNIDSHKALQSTVGHEITHVLEGTELYAEMQKALFDYAKSKKDFDGRRQSLAALYKDIEGADVDAELTADLVGDYLFTDEDFVKHLSTQNRNVFQKMYDEIKYLWKLATAGSKEARELEKVKRAFDKAYKESGKASGKTTEGTKYSLSSEQKEFFKNSKVRDEDGKLLVVYHGSKNSGFNVFRYSEDVQTGTDYGEAYYFTSDRQKASGYSYDVTKDERISRYKEGKDALKEKFLQTHSEEDKKAFLGYKLDGKDLFDMMNDESYLTEGGEVKEVYLNLTDPLIVDANGKYYYEVYPEYFDQARKNGNDGIIVRNVIDNPRGEARPIDTYIAFKPEQIKDVSNKNPTSNPDIRYSLSDSDGKPIDADRISVDENDTRYSLSHNSEIAKGQMDYIANHKVALSQEELAEAQKVTNAMVDVMMKYSSILPEDKIGKVLTKNGSYDRSVENTTICVRTLAYNEFVDKVQEEIGRPLTQMESFLVSQKLYDIAVDPQCLYCYVSLDRKAFNDMLLRYMQDRDTVIAKYNNSDKSDATVSKLYEEFLNGRKDTKNMKDRFNKWLSYVDDGTQLLSLADIATEDRQSVIKANGGNLAAQLADARAYAQSASWSKIQKNYVAYRDEILKLGERVVKNLNEHYGLRWYSFSDYSAAFIVENMQQITDASIRGLKGLSYTKDTDYAEIFAPSGMNINVSVFVNQDANGNFFIDEKQSANFEKALELRERYPNVGIVATVTNDDALRWAASQEWSDVIIPFHIVRTGADVAEYYKWLNYTAESADSVKDSDLWNAYLDSLNLSDGARKKASKNIYPNEHKNDKNTYLNLCESRGLTPRFARFAGEDWYMKLVNETRLSADVSSPLKPIYNLEAAQASFQKFVEKGGYEGGWYKKAINVDAEAKAVAQDVLAGKKANEVSYGRQDAFVPEDLMAGRRTNRVHGKHSLSAKSEPQKRYGNYSTPARELRYEAPMQEEVAPAVDISKTETTTPTVSKTETVENVAPVVDTLPEKSNAPLVEIASQARLENLHGAYTQDGKQYLSDGSFAAEFYTVDDSLKNVSDYPIKRVQRELTEAFERQTPGNYNVDQAEISKLNDGKRRFAKIGNALFDVKYVDALNRAIENPLFTLSHIRGGIDALTVVGDNGRAVLMPVRAGDNVTIAYEAKLNSPVTDTDYAPIPEAEANAMQSENIAHIDDADAPPEMEAPYYGETQDAAPIDPFEDRDMKEVSRDRKTPAYMYENPEVKPFFQAEANILLGELERVEKPETIYNGWAKYEMSYEFAQDIPEVYRTERIASDTIVYLRDTIGMSYADIEKGLKAIIEDHGAENIAAAKKLEFVINDRLLYGYNDDGGFEIPANQDYINLLTEKEIREYSDEARKQFFEVADAYAPQEDIAPVAESKAAPVKERYEAIKPERKKSTEPRLKRVKDADNIAPTENKTAEIYDTEPETGKKKSRGWARFRANFLDKQSVFEDLALKTNNRELMGKANYILSAEQRAQRLIGKGKSSAGVKSLNDIRAEVESTAKTKQFYEYLYHRHNIDRMSLEESKPVFGDSVTADVSRAEVAKYEAANPKFTEYAQDVYDYMNYLRDQMVESGVISQETADLWAQMYPHYVPIRRLGDTGLNINVPLDTGRTGVNAPIKRATGGSRDILPLFDTMALRTEQTYKAIAKNNFGVELKNTLGSTIESAEANLDEMIDSVDAHEELLKKGENGRNPTFTVFEDGKKVTFEITDDMYDALKPTSDDLRYTNKVANTISNVHRGILTEYNPTFMLTNAIKDAQDILINSQHPAKTYANLPNAIAQMAKNGTWYQEYLENGGESNTYFDGQSNTFTKDDTGIKKIIGMPLRAISAVNNYVERAPRLAEYIASRKAGASAEVAMLDAARVTTNFAAGGDVTKFANRNGFTFLNASVQGAMQQVRNVREAKANGLKGWVQLATKVALAGIPAMILNNLLWDDDEEYEQLSDYVKDNYYVVAKFGDGQFVRIPKGRAMAVIQDALEQVGNALTGDDEVDLANFLELAISNLAPNNPLDNNILAPIGQVLSNKTWYGDDLVPTRLQDLPAAEQFDESTDSISKWLGEKLNVSPYKLNYLLNQYSGGVGDVVLPMLTPEAESGDNSLVGNMIAPMKDKFTTDSVMNNQNVSDFYDTVDKLTANAKSSYATDEDILKYKYMNSVNAELSELYKQKREIQNSDLADADKYEAVRDIQKQIDALAEESVNTYGNVIINGVYATVGDLHFRWYEPGEDSEAEPGWQKISDKQLEKQEEVTSGLGIDPSTYWSNKSEYDFAYEYPGKYAVAKSVGGYEKYKTYQSELYDIKADKDEDGKSITGSRKEKVADYINNLDISYEEKIILFKSEYNADDTYNYEIIDYLNNRNDISYDEMVSILKELGFTVKGDTITWD